MGIGQPQEQGNHKSQGSRKTLPQAQVRPGQPTQNNWAGLVANGKKLDRHNPLDQQHVVMQLPAISILQLKEKSIWEI